MARKTTEEPPMPAIEVETELKAVRLYIAQDLHDEFRVIAAKKRTNMAILAREIIEEYVRANRGGAK